MNDSTATIARNTKIMMGAQIVTWASSFVLMSFLPRYLGAEEFGRLYFGISANALAGLLMDLGLTMLVVREVARDRSKVSAFFFNGGMLRILAWALSLILTSLFVVVSGYPMKTIEIVLVLGIANLFWGSYELIHRIFVGLERIEYRSIGLVSEKVFLALVGVTMLLLGYGPLTIAVVILLSMMLNFSVSLFFLRRLVPLHIGELNPSSWKPLLHQGFPFMISVVFAFIYYRVDVMMLSVMTNDEVVGWYGAPYRLFDTLMFFPVILNTAVYPVLSRLFTTSQDNVNSTSRKLLELTLVAAVPVAVGMNTLARPIIALLFGLEEYSNSVILLQLLSVSLLLVYVDFVLNTVLISYNKQRQVSYIAIVATALNIVVNYFAIGYFQKNYGNGAIGSAITTALTEACVMSLSIYVLPRGCFGMDSIVVALKTLAAGGVMAGVIVLVQMVLPFWVPAAIAGMVVYVAVLFLLRVASRDDVRYLISVLPFRKEVSPTVPNS